MCGTNNQYKLTIGPQLTIITITITITIHKARTNFPSTLYNHENMHKLLPKCLI